MKASPVPESYTSHTTTDVEDDGTTETVTRDSNEVLVSKTQIAQTAAAVYKHLDGQRQKLEDARADKRNRNRIYILLVALLMTFLVPFIVANIIGDPGLLKYSTLIAIAPDFALTVFAYVKKF